MFTGMKSTLVFVMCLLGWMVALAEEEPQAKSGKADEVPQGSAGHPFSWPFLGWEKMQPRGGVTHGSEVTLAEEPNPAVARIHEAGVKKRERDRRAILALAGDYRVSFDFIEVASQAHPYQPPRPYFSWATERVMVLADEPEFISLQHVLVMEFVDKEGKVKGPYTMKHWRQDWRYEEASGFAYRGDRVWEMGDFEEVEGTWSQAVYQVDDSPRYEAVGEWDHRGEMSVFRTRDFWRPLPRREFSVRDDYNVLAGSHEITVTPRGWLHTQHNRKVVADGGEIQRVLAHELGAVRYERIASPSLDKAESYWQNAGPFWEVVREKWVQIFEEREVVRLRATVDERPMYAALFELAAKFALKETTDEEREGVLGDVDSVIESYVIGD